ncbi:MAG: hypothetical protein HQ583_03915 [Candidatus Abyssubacteria bacterium]|nr:hypothetical protein [Candidatus Abyssubacteria bacterium]
MNKKWPIVLTIAGVIALSSVAVAQPRWGGGQGWEGRPRNENRARMRERIHMMKMWKLTEVLELDEQTTAKLFPLMREFAVKQQELRAKRVEIVKQMRQELDKDAPDSAVFSPLIDEFKQNERAMVEARITRLDDMSKLLGDEQVAKVIALTPEFERQFRGLLGEARAMRKSRQSRFGEWRQAPGPPAVE